MNTAAVRLWSLQNVFLLWLVKPSVIEVNERRCVIRIPLNWRTRRRDIHAMYLGVLCMGGDVASGLIAFHLARERKLPFSFVFKDMTASFLKRAEGDVLFTNEDGAVVEDLMRRATVTGERVEATVNVTATVPSKLGDEPVAKFAMTLSIRAKSSS